MKQEQLFKKVEKVTFEAWGPVRGACGHTHKTAQEAEKCAEIDRREASRLPGGAYSDRRCWRLIDGVRDARVLVGVAAYYEGEE